MKLASRELPMRIVDVATAGGELPGGAKTSLEQQPSAVMYVVLSQQLSVDLSRLRIHLRARLVSAEGRELMDQQIHYLPTSIPGVSSRESLIHWAADDYRLYREHVTRGVAGAVDALNAVSFSRVDNDPESLQDAKDLLEKTSCYGGDFDAGIPLDAYKAGRILTTRGGVTAIKLQNGDILVFPRCEA